MKTGKSSRVSMVRVFAIALLLLAVGTVANSARAAGEPDLKITMSHIGNFDIGGLGTYTIVVDNTEGAGSILGSTAATVIITLPQGLTAEPGNFVVNDWSCTTVVTGADDTVTCTSEFDVYAPPDSPDEYPALTLDVRVDTNGFEFTFPNQLTPTATVSVPGEVDESDNTDTDPTTINKSDLQITGVSFDPVQPIADEPFEILVKVSNNGAATSESIVYRSVFVDHHPLASDPDGCATVTNTPADTSDWDRGQLNDQIVPGSEVEQPVNASGIPAGTYQIYVMVDATCINIESNEDNNIYGPVSLTVEAPYECGHIFRDVATSYWACSWIEILDSNGITGGCVADANGKDYCPDSSVTRGQMAVFLERGIHTSAFVPPTVPITFLDTVGHWATLWIEALKTDGITSGCLVGYYCPNNTTTRAQMAVFLLKSKYGASYVPPAVGASTGFTDVPVNHWAATWIKQLAAEGITGGCGSGIYCPESPVTRAQMAVFLVRTFTLTR